MLRVAIALFATLASGCFFKPEPPAARSADLDDARGQGSGDGPTPTVDAGACGVRDDFNLTAVDCGDWGAKTVTGSVSIVHGATTLKMSAQFGGTVVCASKTNVDILNGARVEVKSPVWEMYGSTGFEVVDVLSNTRVGLRIDGNGTTAPTVMFKHPDNTTTGQTAFASAEMVVWQLRREEVLLAGATTGIGSTQVALEYSADGISWTELGRHDVGSVKFTGTNVRLLATLATNSTAEFDNLDACP